LLGFPEAGLQSTPSPMTPDEHYPGVGAETYSAGTSDGVLSKVDAKPDLIR
jgi:hypothetical protein